MAKDRFQGVSTVFHPIACISATGRDKKCSKQKLYTDYKQNHVTRLLIRMRYFEKDIGCSKNNSENENY